MRKMTIALLLLTTLSGVAVFAQNIDKLRLDSFFNILSEKNKAMGSVAISKNGSVLYSRAFGYSSISGNGKKPSTTDTKYRVGSVSKMFTAVMVFQLIEEGKIELATTLTKYFPNIPNADRITIANLLNHRSGLHNFTDDTAYLRWMTTAKTQEEMLAIIAGYKVDFEPDAKTAYSNSNFVILGYLIERITGDPYAKALVKRITTRAGLTNTYFGTRTAVDKNESLSFRFDGNNWLQQPETDMSIPGGAGALVSTPVDLAKFIEALFGLKLVDSKSLEQMKTINGGLGMGMFQIPFYLKKAYGHNGGIDGFVSNLAYFPEDSVAVSYCSNGVNYAFNDILIGILSIYFKTPGFAIPDFKTFAIKSADLEKYTGIYSSKQIPLKITISKEDSVLKAQATGQSSFALDAAEKDKFKFDAAGIVIEFNPEKNEFTLKQGGGVFLFSKDK